MIKCIAVDDEPIALSIISSFCERHGGISLITFTNPRDAQKAIFEQLPDLVLLDIQMNDISGLDIAKVIPPECLLVFTTAFANYALEGFELSAVDFLHKPFSYDRFGKMVDKIERIIKGRTMLAHSESDERKLILKVEYKNVALSFGQILYVEAMDNYVKVFCDDGRCVVSQISLKSLELLLPNGEFLRVHKSFVVRCDKVRSFTRRQIVIFGCCSVVPVGRLYSDRVMAFFT